MHIPDQSPEEKQPEEAQNMEQASQPLYEFSASDSTRALSAEEQGMATNEAGVPQQTNTRGQVSSEADARRLPPEDLIRQGLVYPPPPSFYQRTQDVPAQPGSLPPVPLYPVAGSLLPQSIGSVPREANYVQPPPFVPASPVRAKKSYKWIWITVSIFVVLLLASCGFCGWAFYNFFSSTVGPTTNTLTIANKYYAALQDKDYATAYTYIAPQGSLSGMTLDTFTTRAQDADTQYGVVRSYTSMLGNFSTNPSTGPDLSRFTVIVNVSRVKQSYSVLLTLQKSGNSWKIIDFDRV